MKVKNPSSKKRNREFLHDEDEFSDQDMDDEERRAKAAAQKRLKIGAEPEFLELGSTSWSMLLAL